MGEDDEPNLRPPSDTNPEDIGKKATEAALRLVNFDKEPHDKVLDGIIEMAAHYSPIIEEDMNIAKLEGGLFILSDMRNFKVTRVDAYIGSHLAQAYGSAESLTSEKARLEIARAYSSVALLRQAFEFAKSDSSELDRAKLTEFMTHAAPSKFWQDQAATTVAIDNILESYQVAGNLAAGLEDPTDVDGLMKQIEDTYLTEGLGLETLPEQASEFEEKRRSNELIQLMEKGWEAWRQQVHQANAPTDDSSPSA